MTNKVTGRVTLKVNGAALLSKAGATLDFGGVKRTAVEGDNKVNGYTETIAAPQVSCTISHTADTSLQQIANFVDETLLYQTDTGHHYVLSQAWLMEPPKLQSNGDVALSFGAITCDEI